MGSFTWSEPSIHVNTDFLHHTPQSKGKTRIQRACTASTYLCTHFGVIYILGDRACLLWWNEGIIILFHDFISAIAAVMALCSWTTVIIVQNMSYLSSLITRVLFSQKSEWILSCHLKKSFTTPDSLFPSGILVRENIFEGSQNDITDPIQLNRDGNVFRSNPALVLTSARQQTGGWLGKENSRWRCIKKAAAFLITIISKLWSTNYRIRCFFLFPFRAPLLDSRLK